MVACPIGAARRALEGFLRVDAVKCSPKVVVEGLAF
jgi:hypothetical protein